VTEVNEYPWQAAVITRSGGFCGGSLLSDQWVLTAAHCTDGKTVAGIQVHLGQHDLYSATESKLLRMSVEKIVEHPNYHSESTNFDFSLLKMSSRVDFLENPHVRPICLPADTSQSYAGYLATTSGWGTTSSGGNTASKLREVEVKVISNQECQDMGYKPEWITSQMMCAGVGGGGKDSCQGDSGEEMGIVQP
jgi:secreted trypsin-like serine protease